MKKMKIKAASIFLVCLTVFLGCAFYTAFADAPDSSARTSLSIHYVCEGADIGGVTASLYRVAEFDSKGAFKACGDFAEYPISFNGITTTTQWDALAQTLASYIAADRLQPVQNAVSDAQGIAHFDGNPVGMYLVLSSRLVDENGKTITFLPALLSLPGQDENGSWIYDVLVCPKYEVFSPGHKEIDFRVLKHWKNDNAETRPDSVEVAILKDGITVTKQTLSAENNWSYEWSAEDDGSQWSVVEITECPGYTVTMERNQNQFIITNQGKDPPPPPVTGERSDKTLFIMMMSATGLVLMLIGIRHQKRRKV